MILQAFFYFGACESVRSKFCSRGWLGLLIRSAGLPRSITAPCSMNQISSATSRAKPISWVTHDHGHAAGGQLFHDGEHLTDHFRIERLGRLVEQHDFGIHGERARNRDALALAAGQFAGHRLGLLGEADAGEFGQARSRASALPILRSLVRPRVMLPIADRCGNRL